ncbi:MAG TPA: farnesyl diphosphate synthase [Hyphomicrobiaceae bacterium]|jgi:farnesyl diphosphate synthase|nr:farnesyl diphosphate synthase [Hyphomicrobiaceae bacterium]
MAFSQRLELAARLVERRLSTLLDASVSAGAPERLVAAMRHATLGGGKRLRPFLAIESAALFDVAAEIAVDAAAALECVHCYSLVHDDLPAMDNDDLRRGRPTVHKAFDEWTAILAGDALLTLAFEVLANVAAPGGAGGNGELVASLARAAGAAGMVGGQCLDLEADKLSFPLRPDAAHIEHLQTLKTGALFRCACELGAILGQAGPIERRALETYGARLGLAFQIADDLLDVEGDAATMGKAARKDAAKATLHAASDVETARRRLAAMAAEATSALAPFDHRAEILRAAAAFTVQRER